MQWRVAAVVLLAMGCESRVPAAPSCKTQVAELRQFHRRVSEAMDLECPLRGATLAPMTASAGTNARRAEDALTAQLGATQATLDEQPTSMGELPNALQMHRNRFDKIATLGGPSFDGRLFVGIAPDVPWQRVVAFVDAAMAAGFTRLSFAFAVEYTAPVAPASSLDAELARVRGTPEAQAALTAMWARMATACPPLATEIAKVRNVPIAQRADAIRAAVERGVAACDCRVEIPALEVLASAVMQRGSYCREVRTEVSPQGAPLALPATMPWAQAAQQLVVVPPQKQPLRLVAR